MSGGAQIPWVSVMSPYTLFLICSFSQSNRTVRTLEPEVLQEAFSFPVCLLKVSRDLSPPWKATGGMEGS